MGGFDSKDAMGGFDSKAARTQDCSIVKIEKNNFARVTIVYALLEYASYVSFPTHMKHDRDLLELTINRLFYA